MMIDENDSFERSAEGFLVHPTLFKLDSKGKVRTWRMERDGSRYRTLSGLKGGKQAVSGWTQATAASQDTDEAQAMFEVKAQYQHQLDREYRRTEAELASVKDEFIQPMLAKPYSKWPGFCFFQPKLDGIRCIMTKDGMFTRQGQPITAVPHLHAQLAKLFDDFPTLILDGELYSHDLRDDFGAISSIVRKKNPTAAELELAEKVMQYHVYDIVDTDVAFSHRSATVRRLLQAYVGDIQIVPTLVCDSSTQADEAYGEYVSLGYEGGMYRLDEPYQLGKRSTYLLKRKDFMTEEFPLRGLEEGNGNWAGAVKRAVFDGFAAGIRGSYVDMVKLMSKCNAGEIDFSKAEATVRFFGRSPDGVPRFPVVVDLHLQGRKD